MINKKLLLPAFLLVSLVQLFVPAKMIWDREDILKTGTEYKFETAPVDPTDPFRGKYIILRFTEDRVEVKESDDWKRGERAYALLSVEPNGYTKINSVEKSKPSGNVPYLKTSIRYNTKMQNRNSVHLDFPFDRYYMEESKAKPAEDIYVQTQRDTSTTTYALVSVKEGDAVLKDVMIDDISIREIVKNNQ